MTNDDKTHWLQLYKKECRNYFNYRSKRDKCELELEETLQNITISAEERLISLIEVKTETEHQIDFYKAMIAWIEHVNQNITSPAYRAITWQTLIQAKNKTDLMINYDVDPDYVYYMRDRFLGMALDDKMRQEYYDAMKKKSLSKWLSM